MKVISIDYIGCCSYSDYEFLYESIRVDDEYYNLNRLVEYGTGTHSRNGELFEVLTLRLDI